MFGEKLTILRKQRGYSLRYLAEKLNLSHTAINKFEKNILKPDSKTLIQICQFFDVKPAYFYYKPLENIEIKDIKYRKKSVLSKKNLEIIEYKTREKIEKFFELKSFFPENRFFNIDISDITYEIINLDEIENLSIEIRKKLNLGEESIPNLLEVLEENGFFILFIENFKGFDGKQGFANDIPFIVLSENKSGDRQRFNLAHELGHILIKNNENLDSEKVANMFAGCLLIPANSLLKELGEKRQSISLHELGELKKKYRVSMQSIIMRAFQLKIISERAKEELFKYFSMKKWRQNEPIQIEIEHTDKFKRLVCEAVEEGYISESKGAEYLNITTSDFIKEYLKGLNYEVHN